MQRIIKKVAMLGSGVMGSRIACHFAGIGIQVLLLDILSASAEAEKGSISQRNQVVNDALSAALKSNPSPVFNKDAAKKIKTGNFTDNMKDIASYDWIIEVVVERLDIKQSIFTEVEKYRTPGTLITSNTSGIPTTSAVLKVADFGLPIIGPVKASISSIVNCNFSIAFIIAIIPKTPMRLAINAGVSLHNTVVFPKNKSP
jgi:3-hydroxyacyl-CoA dehydrogenase